MPIQNVGTLLENMVITESVSVMLNQVPEGKQLGFATAFAMPTLSEWRPHAQAVGLSDAALKEMSRSHDDTDFVTVMSCCVSYCREKGPNGALLAAVLATIKGSGLRIWANDIPDGHYGNAIPSLERIAALIEKMLPAKKPDIVVRVSDRPYPWSLDDLKAVVSNWAEV